MGQVIWEVFVEATFIIIIFLSWVAFSAVMKDLFAYVMVKRQLRKLKKRRNQRVKDYADNDTIQFPY